MRYKTVFGIAIGIAAAVGTTLAQGFEVASIRSNKAGGRTSIEATPGNLTMRNVSLRTCVRWAYGVHDYQISGGTDWLGSDRYDIVAKTPAAASEDQARVMLRALLADRFKVSLHHLSRELPVYVLSVGKNGPKLQASKVEGERSVGPVSNGLAFRNASMADLNDFLSTMPSMDRPVLERTGLQGRFDFTLVLFDPQQERNPAAVKGAAVNAGPDGYADALEQIGLKLDRQRASIDTLVIDHAEKPSEN